MSRVTQKPASKRAQIKRSLAQSEYITATWTWFLILAGKAAEPVLVASVLYASVKLLPVVHFSPQWDVVVFVAQFVALDVGGLSLNTLADQAQQDGDEQGATQARRLSIALVAIMLTGVVMAGVKQVVTLDSQVSTVIDTLLLIARAIMAVLYSRVIHRLRHDQTGAPVVESDPLEALVAEAVKTALTEPLAVLCQQLEASLSHPLDERLTRLESHQTQIMASLKDELATIIREMLQSLDETAGHTRARIFPIPPKTNGVSPEAASSPHGRALTQAAASRKPPTGSTGEREIDTILWPLLDTGLSIRAIAAQVSTSPATVGRSRQRWLTGKRVSPSHGETRHPHQTQEETL